MQQQPFEKPGRNSLALGIAIGVGVSILAGNLVLLAMHANKLDVLAGELEVVSQRMQSLAEENAALKGELERVSAEYSQMVVSAGQRAAVEEAKRKAAAEAARVRASRGGTQVAGNLDDLIISLVSQHWRRPPVTRNGVSTMVLLQMGHDGTITGVGVNRSSGDQAFDQSVVDALLRLGRIPEMSQLDRSTFERMYAQRRMIFKPEDLGR